MKLIMTLLVRDAENLLGENLEFHIQQGVNFFIITDNLSVDGTSRIIEKYVAAGRAEKIWQPEDTFSQGRWVTRMARRAATVYGADWVINGDDDEFWSAKSGSLNDLLGSLSREYSAIEVPRHNHPPIVAPTSEHFLASMVYRENRSLNVLGEPLPPKIIHRAFADIEVDQGNHDIRRSGVRIAAQPTSAIAISHFPIRDYPSFERKIISGGAAYERNTELGPDVGRTWRSLYALWRQGGLKAWYDRQLLHPDQITEGLAGGSWSEDEFVRRAVGPWRRDQCNNEV